MSNKGVSLQEIQNEFELWQTIFNSIISDIDTSRKQKILYNFDFSFLFDYVWDKPAVGVPAWVPGGKNIIEHFINSPIATRNLNLIFTGPSFYELLDSIKHKLDTAKSLEFSLDSIYNRINDEIDKNKDLSDIDTVFVNSGISKTIKDYLPLLKENYTFKQSLNRLKTVFLDGEIFTGIADHIDRSVFEKHWNTFKENYIYLLNRMLKNRPDKRPMKDRTFHFGVDSANITSTIKTNIYESNIKMYFVTQDGLRRRYCSKEGRSPYVPLFIMSSEVLSKNNKIGNQRDYFLSLKDTIYAIKKDLDRVTSLEQIPGKTKQRIVSFYSEDMRDLGNSEVESKELQSTSVEQLRAIFKDKDKIEASFKESRKDLEDIADFLLVRNERTLEKDITLKIMEGEHEDKIINEIRNAFIKHKNQDSIK
jgi:hypothetical protein